MKQKIKHQPLFFSFDWIQRLSDKIYYTGFKAANKGW
jgi:hypothetical protein